MRQQQVDASAVIPNEGFRAQAAPVERPRPFLEMVVVRSLHPETAAEFPRPYLETVVSLLHDRALTDTAGAPNGRSTSTRRILLVPARRAPADRPHDDPKSLLRRRLPTGEPAVVRVGLMSRQLTLKRHVAFARFAQIGASCLPIVRHPAVLYPIAVA